MNQRQVSRCVPAKTHRVHTGRHLWNLGRALSGLKRQNVSGLLLFTRNTEDLGDASSWYIDGFKLAHHLTWRWILTPCLCDWHSDIAVAQR